MLFLALLAHIAAAKGGPAAGTADAKCGPIPCLYSTGGLHAILGNQVPYNQGGQACAEFGWQLADILPGNAMHAQNVIRECLGAGGQAWIQSFNGLTGEPCMEAGGLGFAGVGNCWADALNPQLKPVLCQEPQLATQTLLSISTWPVTQGIKTVTETTSVWAPLPTGRPNRQPDGDLLDFRVKSGADCPLGSCDLVCPFQYPSLRVLMTDHVSFGQAEGLCRKYGWRLASVGTGSMDKVLDLFALCKSTTNESIDTPVIMWARSYNGVSSAACNVIMRLDFLFALSSEVCAALHEDSAAWVLCQTEGPVAEEEALGGWRAATRTTTVSSTTTAMLLIPSATTTVTVTETIRCRKGHCRPVA